MEQISLWSSSAQRDNYDHMANLFAIIKTAEALEKAYARGEDARTVVHVHAPHVHRVRQTLLTRPRTRARCSKCVLPSSRFSPRLPTSLAVDCALPKRARGHTSARARHAAGERANNTCAGLCLTCICSSFQFLADFQLSAGAGYARLESGFPSVEKSSNPKIILQATQNYITLMDSLKLNMCAVDTLQPILSDLVESVRRVRVSVVAGGH